MSGADLVLNDLADEGGAQLGRERKCRVLVDRPECVAAAVSAREPEHPRLAPAAAAARREPAGEARQVEYFDLHGRGPEVSVVGAQQQPVEPARAVLRARDDRLSACRVRRTGLPGDARRRQGRRDAQAELGASWLEMPFSRAIGYAEPVSGSGIHSHGFTARRGNTCACHPKCPPCGPPVASGWWASTTTARPPALLRAARSESITSPSESAGHDDAGPSGFGPSCSHHCVSSATSRTTLPTSTTAGPGHPPARRSADPMPPAAAMKRSCRRTASHPPGPCRSQS